MKLASKWLLSLNEEDIQKLLSVEANNIKMDYAYLERRKRILEEKEASRKDLEEKERQQTIEHEKKKKKTMTNNKVKDKHQKQPFWLCQKRREKNVDEDSKNIEEIRENIVDAGSLNTNGGSKSIDMDIGCN